MIPQRILTVLLGLLLAASASHLKGQVADSTTNQPMAITGSPTSTETTPSAGCRRWEYVGFDSDFRSEYIFAVGVPF